MENIFHNTWKMQLNGLSTLINKGIGMYTITSRNVSEAFYLGLQAIDKIGNSTQTRGGLVAEFPTPVCTTYKNPKERVLFYPVRDANPYFHLMESLWMLAGRNDVEWISQFNGRINTYSDDGETFHGAYGFRWREWFLKDQLEDCIVRLTTFANDRRTVLSMWDCTADLTRTNDGKDYPCNTHIYFQARDGILDMTVCNRSNDMIWGAYGANAVHMSVLQEYIAARCGMKVGAYYQVSNNLHAYTEVLEKMLPILGKPDYDPYACINDDGTHYIPPDIVTAPEYFDVDLYDWFDDPNKVYNNSWLNNVATPMFYSWKNHKAGEKQSALLAAELIEDKAWSKACTEWLERRYNK